jgi:thioredoxin-related protein
MKRSLLLSLVLLLSQLAAGQLLTPQQLAERAAEAGKSSGTAGDIRWVSFEEAVKLNEKEPRKILIDFYTHWCGWCKRMDATTYKDPVVVNYINSKYYAVKFDAETRDTIRFVNKFAADSKEKVFVYKPEFKANEFALTVLNGQMGYPTTVFMDEKLAILTPVSGYVNNQFMETVLKYFGENAYKTAKWEEYQKQFKGEAR